MSAHLTRLVKGAIPGADTLISDEYSLCALAPSMIIDTGGAHKSTGVGMGIPRVARGRSCLLVHPFEARHLLSLQKSTHRVQALYGFRYILVYRKLSL